MRKPCDEDVAGGVKGCREGRAVCGGREGGGGTGEWMEVG